MAGKSKKSGWALQNMMTNAQNKLLSDSSLGYNPQQDANLLNDYQKFLENKAVESGRNFYKQNESDLYNAFVQRQTDANRNQLQNWFNNTFGGYGTTNSYLNKAWNTNADTQFNKDYLNSYYDQAQSQLDTAFKRGVLNQSGYDSAISALGKRNQAAQNELNTLTDSVINQYRDDLANMATGFQTAIDDYSLANRGNYNPTEFINQYNDLLTNQRNNLTADLSAATQGYTPYSVSDLLADARNAQGIVTGITPTQGDSELLSSMQDKNKNQNKFGLGNQGIF